MHCTISLYIFFSNKEGRNRLKRDGYRGGCSNNWTGLSYTVFKVLLFFTLTPTCIDVAYSYFLTLHIPFPYFLTLSFPIQFHHNKMFATLRRVVRLPVAARHGQFASASTLSEREIKLVRYVAHSLEFSYIALFFFLGPSFTRTYDAQERHRCAQSYVHDAVSGVWNERANYYIDTDSLNTPKNFPGFALSLSLLLTPTALPQPSRYAEARS